MPIEEAVARWIRSEGYPLEFRTAKIFNECHYTVRQGEFTRGSREAPREIDVVAYRTRPNPAKGFARIEHVVECKWSKDKPWVIFTSEGHSIHPRACAVQTIASGGGAKMLRALVTPPHNIERLSLFKSGQRSGFGGRQAFSDKADTVYGALQGVVSKAFSEASHVDERPQGWRTTIFVFPVIVLDGALFEAFWDDATNDLRTEPVDLMRLHWRGSDRWRQHATVDIVRIEHLATYLADREKDVEVLLEAASSTQL